MIDDTLPPTWAAFNTALQRCVTMLDAPAYSPALAAALTARDHAHHIGDDSLIRLAKNFIQQVTDCIDSAWCLTANGPVKASVDLAEAGRRASVLDEGDSLALVQARCDVVSMPGLKRTLQ